MPHVPTVPPADRFFARLDRFECECPSCGRVIFTVINNRTLPARLQAPAHLRRDAKQLPKSKRILQAAWNPFTQRLTCPWCGRAYVAGLMLYPLNLHVYSQKALDAPPDTVPTSRQLAEMRRRAGGWHARQLYQAGEHVNQAVLTPCSCGEGWNVRCPVHGDPEQLGAKVDARGA